MTKVKNVNGSSRFSSPAGYNTWLDYWEAKSGKTASRCSATDCHQSGRWNLVGAHVQKYTAMTIAGILCLSVEAVTLAPTSFMLTRLWFQYQAISNIKRFY